jgi:hypothetical protein
MSIKVLPIQTSHAIRSSYLFPTISSIVEEVVQNAIEKRATVLDIFVDYQKYRVVITHNAISNISKDLEYNLSGLGHVNTGFELETKKYCNTIDFMFNMQLMFDIWC